MQADEFRAHGHRLIEWIIDYHQRLDTLPVQSTVQPGEIAALLPELRAGGLAPVTANGVLGDPTGADSEEGRRLFELLRSRARDAVQRWSPSEHGMIG